MSTEIGDENHLQIGFILERLFREFHLLHWMEGATCTAFSSPIVEGILFPHVLYSRPPVQMDAFYVFSQIFFLFEAHNINPQHTCNILILLK